MELKASQRARAERYGAAGYRQFVIERAKLVRDLLRGHTTKEVATLLETNPSTIVQWKRQVEDSDVKQRHQKRASTLTQSQRRRIQEYGSGGLQRFRRERARLIGELQNEGLTFRQIGKLLGVSHTLARRWGNVTSEPSSRQGQELLKYVKRNLTKGDLRVVEFLASKGDVPVDAITATLELLPERLQDVLRRLRNFNFVVGDSSVALTAELQQALETGRRRAQRRKTKRRSEEISDAVPAVLAASDADVAATRMFLDSKIKTHETRRKYAQAIKRFGHWCDQRGLRKLSDLTQDTIEEYHRELVSAFGRGSTAKLHISGLRSWLNYLAECSIVTVEPTARRHQPQQSITESPRAWSRSKLWLVHNSPSAQEEPPLHTASGAVAPHR